jgi:hypothetical protein
VPPPPALKTAEALACERMHVRRNQENFDNLYSSSIISVFERFAPFDRHNKAVLGRVAKRA